MKFKWAIPPQFAWIPGKIKQWELWKPTIRCAIVTWVCLVLFLIVPLAHQMGQAAFFILICCILNPPSDPLAIWVIKQFWILVFIGIAWGWAAIGYAVANAVRSNAVPYSSLEREDNKYPGLQASNPEAFLQYATFDGIFLQTAPSAVHATFLGVGVFALIYARSKLLPSFGEPLSSIFGCILLDVVHTYGALIPTYDAVLGSVFVIPMAMFTAVAFLGSILIFPETVQEQYCQRYIAVLNTIKETIDEQPDMLATPPSGEKWQEWAKLTTQRETLGAAYVSLDVVGSNLNREFSWGRFSHEDLQGLQDGLRKLIVRIGGMAYFQRTVSEWLERKNSAEEHADELAHSRAPSPAHDHDQNEGHDQEQRDGFDSLPASRNLTPEASYISLHPLDAVSTTETSHLSPSASLQESEGTSTHRHLKKKQHHSHQHHSLPWLHLQESSLHVPKPVGVFESIRYMSVQSRFLVPGDLENVDDMVKALGEAVDDMVKACSDTVESIVLFFTAVRKDKFWRLKAKRGRAALVKEDLEKKEALRERLVSSIATFKVTGRISVLSPYRDRPLTSRTPYRGLFFVCVYSFHLTEFADALVELLDDVIAVEKTRTKSKVWWPQTTWTKMFGGGAQSEGNELDDESPEDISNLEELNVDVEARDPDADPPTNAFNYYGGKFQRGLSSMFRKGDAFFAAKAGILTVLVALPQYVQETASFTYYNRGLWVLILAQLSLQRWAGDTFLQWIYKTLATFFGALIGAALWYISSGVGPGSPYGLGAVGAVVLPFLIFIRLHSPYIVFSILFTVTIMLVIGFSWQDGQGGFTLVDPGEGWEVAWRRFITVMLGISIAAVFALIPPETSRHTVRRTLSRVISQMGSVHADLLTYAGRTHTHANTEIVDHLVKVNAKLRRYLTPRIEAAEYEPSLSGHWPAEKYRKLQKTLLELSDLLGQLMTVYWRIGGPNLDKLWRRGLVLRTRFLQPTFIGDTMSIYYILSVAIKTGQPLPQILPTPLVDRAFDRQYGLRVPHGPDQDAGGHEGGSGVDTPDRLGIPIPGHSGEKHVRLEDPASPLRSLDREDLTFEMLSDEGYMIFVTGVLTTYDMLTRLDTLAMVVRELVGERYPIKGLDKRSLFADEVV